MRRLAGMLFAITVAAAEQTPERVSADRCSASVLGGEIPAGSIGEPVSGVVLNSFAWVDASGALPAYCRVDGELLPVETGTTAKPIHFRVLLPAMWNGRSAQLGGGGMNGVVPDLTAARGITTGAPPLARGFATYGSDSGHTNGSVDWALSDEAIRNLGYMQMKKTHDAATILIERAYGARPKFNYYFGTSQGGREALTVARRSLSKASSCCTTGWLTHSSQRGTRSDTLSACSRTMAVRPELDSGQNCSSCRA